MWDTLIQLYRFGGREAVKRAVTPPKRWVERACAKTGADVQKSLEERDEAVQQLVEFVESLSDPDFEDPD